RSRSSLFYSICLQLAPNEGSLKFPLSGGPIKMNYSNIQIYNTTQHGSTCHFGHTCHRFAIMAGEEHTSMNRLTDAFYMVKFKGTKAEFRSFNPSTLLPPGKRYWTYAGSLTTPPLHESVTWIVLKEAIQISEKQMEKFRSLLFTTEEDEKIPMVNNFRPPQPLKGRVVRASFKI
uniref:Alpha-carbonic anhydrase domain-containing protein n=1 Tax=Laticauda laticaudata TaxID=8630 RepID=A0A8C5WQW4_LATLA